MPADYLAVKNSCIDKKEKDQGEPCSEKQIQACKKMAAMWWVKKHNKPFPKDSATSSASISYDISESLLDVEKAKSIRSILDDKVGALDINNASILSLMVDVSVEDGIYFPQPFEKINVNYALAPLNEDGWLLVSCGRCIHRVCLSGVSNSFSDGLCHLVQGMIDSDYICDYFTESLICSVDDIEDKLGASTINETN